MANFLSRAYRRTTATDLFVRHITSWFLPPVVLACVRALFSLYIFVTLFVTIGLEVSTGNSWSARYAFIYFTILTYWSLGFYFAVSAIHGFIYSARGRSGFAAAGTAHDSEAGARQESGGVKGVLRWAHGWYYATITSFPFLITIVFWAFLSSGALYNPFSIWNNISEHALNSVFALFEVIVPRTEATAWIHVVPCVIFLSLYLGLTYLSHSINGFYVYPFLDVETNGSGITAAYIVGILVVTIIIFAIVHFIIKLRRWLTETKMGATGKFSRRDVQAARSEQGRHEKAILA